MKITDKQLEELLTILGEWEGNDLLEQLDGFAATVVKGVQIDLLEALATEVWARRNAENLLQCT